MDARYNMNSLLLEAIQEIAIEMVVDPFFVEKDFYAVHVLSKIAEIQIPDVEIVFTGGTSLSKAYRLIQRFSEDLDFRICSTKPQSKGQRRAIRKQILSVIKGIEKITVLEDSLQIYNESRFFSIDVAYPQQYPLQNALRPHLQLEFTFENTLIATEMKIVQPFVSTLLNPEDYCTIQTISPIETGANKYSALLWRMSIKDRQKEDKSKNDPNLVRHLHDLAALLTTLQNDSAFVELVQTSFAQDKGRGGSNPEVSLEIATQQVLSVLKSDMVYRLEYQHFVTAMSYASDAEQISFEKAVEAFRQLAEFFVFER